MSDLPKFEPLPNVGNVVSNNVTAFNQGYNLYQCINYLQGYVSIVYENMDALLDDWNNFQQVINDNISNIATEETQKVLNQWLEDGTLNDLIAQNPLWNQKLDKTGGTMTGNIKFSENTKIVGTTPGGNDIDLIHNTNDGASGNYVKFGDADAKTVINSSQQPVWHNGDDDYLLLTQSQLDTGLDKKVSKSGDTMTGSLNLNASLSVRDNITTDGGYYILKRDDQNLIFGDSNCFTNIRAKNDRIYMRKTNNSNVGVLVTDDIINNITSSSTTKVLSAEQGKVLNDKIMFAYQQKTTVKGATFQFFKYNNLVLCKVNNIGAMSSGAINEFDNAIPTSLRPKTYFYLNYNAVTGSTVPYKGRYQFGDDGKVVLITDGNVTLEHNGQIIYSLEGVTTG